MPPAVELVGLPSRVIIGPEYPFGLENTLATDATVVDALVHVEMRGAGGGVFFEGDTRKRGDEIFYVYLELKDRSKTATVSASYVEQALDGMRCARTVEQTITGVRRLYFPPRCHEGRYKPRSVIVFCGDGGMVLRKTGWRGWNNAVATGRARASVNNCEPSCVDGRVVRYRVALRVYRIRRCEDTGRYQYTRLRVTFRGRKWSGPRHFTQRMGCF